MRSIERIRLQRRMSRHDLADASGVPYGQIARIELGMTYGRASVLAKLAAALHVDVADIIDDKGAADGRIGLPRGPHAIDDEIARVS